MSPTPANVLAMLDRIMGRIARRLAKHVAIDSVDDNAVPDVPCRRPVFVVAISSITRIGGPKPIRAHVTSREKVIGHATEAMTHHYSHVGEDEKREAVARVFAIVKGDEGSFRGGRQRRDDPRRRART